MDSQLHVRSVFDPTTYASSVLEVPVLWGANQSLDDAVSEPDLNRDKLLPGDGSAQVYNSLVRSTKLLARRNGLTLTLTVSQSRMLRNEPKPPECTNSALRGRACRDRRAPPTFAVLSE